MSRVLVVDDEKGVRDSFSLLLAAAGHEVATAASATAALDLLARQDMDVVLTDLLMPGMNGLELLRRVRALAPRTQVIVMTGEPTDETAKAALAAGAADYLAKPIRGAVLFAAVAAAAQQAAAVPPAGAAPRPPPG